MVREKIHKPQTVAEAKENLRAISSEIDYFGVIKRNPIKSVGAAMLAGMMWNKIEKNVGLPPGLGGILLQVIKRL